MPYPEDFYQTIQEQSSNVSKKSPPGTPDIDSLVRYSELRWLGTDLILVQKPKTLVLADFTASSWTSEKLDRVISILCQALDDGFPVLLYENYRVIQLTKPLLKEIVKRNTGYMNSFYEPKKIISDVLRALTTITPEQIQILDNYWLDYLLDSVSNQSSMIKPRTVTSTQLVSVPENTLDKMMASELEPTFSHVIHDAWNIKTNEKITKIQSEGKKIIFDIEKMTVSDFQLKELFEKKSIQDEGIVFSEENLKNIKMIDLDNGSLDILSKLLMKTPKLEKLLFIYNDIDSSEFSISSSTGKNIETLEMTSYFANQDKCFLNQFLVGTAAFTKLRKVNLKIQRDKKNSDLITFSTERLNIEELELDFILCETINIHKLTSLTPHLKKLKLSLVDIEQRNISLELPFLKHLEEFTIILSTKSCISLNKISSYEIPNVKKLILITDEFGDITSFPISNNLEEIHLENNSFNRKNDLSILQPIAEYLKKISLKGNIIISKEFDLPELEELDLNDSIIEKIALQQLYSRAPKLKRIFTTYGKVLNLLHELRLSDSVEVIYPTIIKNPVIEKAVNQIGFIHNPEDTKDFKPETRSFEFKGTNKSQNQEMIIEKISQYWTLTHQHLALIPKIQDGICTALSVTFAKEHEKWESLIDPILNWDGTEKKLTNNQELEYALKFISEVIKKYQLNNPSKKYFVGSNLSELLKDKKPHVLSTAWHALAIVPNRTGDETKVYDPNFEQEPKNLSDDKVLDTINKYTTVTMGPDEKLFSIKAKIPDPGLFIQNGGLLILARVVNTQDLLEILAKVEKPFTQRELDGLLLRDTKGTPAWVSALKNPEVSDYAFKLLLQFIDAYDDPNSLLKKSLEILTPFQHHEIIVRLHELLAPQKTKSTKVIKLIEAIRTQPKTSYYEKQFETWRKKIEEPGSLLEYSQRLLTYDPKKKKILLKFNSSNDLNGMHRALRQYSEKIHRPCFYVHHPRDLICSSQWIVRDFKNEATINDGPGGPLYDFILGNKDKDPIIIVNYENFTASDIIRFNGILDKKPHADGTSLPEKTRVIGLQNTKAPHCYQGSDFYGRFNEVETTGVSREMLKPKPLPFVEAKDCKQTERINLYHGSDWRELLLGTWKIKKDRFVFEEGKLISALKSKLPLEICNGLWQNKEFCDFWQDAIEMGYIENAGQKIQIPKDLKLVKTEGYDRSLRAKHLTFNRNLKPHIPVLNPGLCAELFNRYECDEKKQLDSLPGLIKANAGKTLDVNLTRSLHEDQWGRIVDECETYHVTLNVHYAPSDVSEIKLPPSTQLISSNDLDATLEQFIEASKDEWQVIDISECDASDLLLFTEPQFIKTERFYRFEQKDRALLEGIKAGKNIILKGHFSSQLADALAPFLLERISDKDAKGKLVLMPADNIAFPYLPIEKRHVKAEDKLKLLKKDFPDFKISEELLESTPLCELRAKASSPASDPWLGMRRPPPYKKPAQKIDYKNAETLSKQFTDIRLAALKRLLTVAPYAFLTGLSGVGKTTFVQEDLLENLKNELPSGSLYQGEEHLTAWAEDKTPGTKILFIDEANLSKRQWSEFEGLFNHPPGILIAGKYHELSKNKKIVFAGNPTSYGDERKLSTFFARHGNALLFDPLPPEYIYQHTLSPIFQNTSLAPQAEAISDVLFRVYHYINACSTEDVLITPRELEMMALLTVAFASNNPHANRDELQNIAHHYAYNLGKNLVPKIYQEHFEQVFAKKSILKHEVKDSKTNFVITPTRKTTCDLLDDLFSLRLLRRNKSLTNKKQLYGGLGGVILEGEPATGKSELIIERLKANGYRADGSNPDKVYYEIPVTMDLKDKEDLLLKAFNEGAVVVIDEINSSPMMERLLNSLLMGKTPDGKDPINPGFILIGSQNPCSMGGRRAASTALSRRLINLSIPLYPKDELLCILLSKNIPLENAKELVAAYQKQVNFAKLNHLSPEPTLRDLLRRAKEALREERAIDMFELMDSYAPFLSKLDDLRNMANESKRKQNRDINFIPAYAKFKEALEAWKNEQNVKYGKDSNIQDKITDFSAKMTNEMVQIYATFKKAGNPRGLLFKPPESWSTMMASYGGNKPKMH